MKNEKQKKYVFSCNKYISTRIVITQGKITIVADPIQRKVLPLLDTK